jgi:hypothetical protein
MVKTMTFKSLLVVLTIALGFQVSFAQTFWTETFSDVVTAEANWIHGGTNGSATPVEWIWTDDLDAGAWNGPATGLPTGDTGYFWFDSDGNSNGAHDVTLTGVGNPASCTGKSNVHLRLNTFFRTFSGSDLARIGISTNGTTFTYHNVPEFDALVAETPTAIQQYEGVIDIAIPEADGQAQVWVQFRWAGDFEYYWKVDDLELYEFVPPVNDVTFKVNASLITVSPAGMFFANAVTGFQAMTNEGNGVWSYTAPLAPGTYTYRFVNGPNPANAENSPALAACGVANPTLGNFDRTTTVGTEDLVLPAVCFNDCAPCAVPCALNPDKIACDNMESYATNLKLAAQNITQQGGAANAWWTTWSGATGNTEDGIVSTEQASSGTKSFKILTTAAAGGPQDVVLKLGNKTTGRYELKWKYFVPTGKQAYYNIQNVVPIGAGSWNLDAFFGANNAGNIQIGAGASLAEFTYPSNEWFEVKHIIDLDNNLLTLWVDGVFVHKMAYPNNLGGIDFFGIDNNHTNYIDDVEYIQLPALVYNVDICDAAVDLTLFFGQNITQTTGIYDNTNATASPNDPAVDCWGETAGADILNTTMWYTFTGDGDKYHIETVPCTATNYITGPGDTQMLFYSGDDCTDLTEVVCNDDLYPSGVPDWRSAVDIETVAGQNYFMMIDGFDGTVFGGELSVGEFCIEITKVPSITCADGVIGTYDVSSLYLCEGSQLADLIAIDPTSFVIPNQGPYFGLAWAITSGPVDPNVLPTEADILVGSTGFLPDPFVVGYVNTGNPFPPNVYFITPIIVAGAEDGDPATQGVNLFDVDATNGCFFIGASTPVFFLPLTDDISATAVAGVGSVNLTPAGGIGDITGDPVSYSYLWSNGATTQDLTNVPAGTYTCTVSDDCSLSGTASATVTTVGTVDPASIQSFVVSPNPTSGIVTLSLSLANAADVRIEVLNTLGQTVQTLNAGKLSNLSQNVNLSNMSQGAYFLRVTVDGETAIRRVVVQR